LRGPGVWVGGRRQETLARPPGWADRTRQDRGPGDRQGALCAGGTRGKRVVSLDPPRHALYVQPGCDSPRPGHADELRGTLAGSHGTAATTPRTLFEALTPPGTSYKYYNPGEPSTWIANHNDHAITVGKWVQALPGNANAHGVTTQLDWFISTQRPWPFLCTMRWPAKGRTGITGWPACGLCAAGLRPHWSGQEHHGQVRQVGEQRRLGARCSVQQEGACTASS